MNILVFDDNISMYDYTDPKYAGKMFNLYWDEIGPIKHPDVEDNIYPDMEYKFYATHAFKYCIEHRTLWFDEYVISGDRERLDDFMRLHNLGCFNIILIDSDDLDYDIMHGEEVKYMGMQWDKDLYDIPIHGSKLNYGLDITYITLDEATNLINDNIWNNMEIKNILHTYKYGQIQVDKYYTIYELLDKGYTREELIKLMRTTDEYRIIYAYNMRLLRGIMDTLCTGLYCFYDSLEFVPWTGTIREYYLSCSNIYENKGSNLICEISRSLPEHI